ncbi:ATP-dependent DNA helicase PIF1 [Metarhizium robertsii ARSEF 23]|uniref:ATP-dependent DNA helicase PIF1 n=1 Tax=Metarhizium robertsii (strain ARSEF 23 / ATCC MYA-3075) TaxID=655844 RepID=E9EMR5_METRA|nr:ATP-dependent DNA helicase PIF1 [Metarhizium robertsii ARSEF 23]EFZ04536.1 ATP-dependent DNA helicase PIF1 [Metarhizium robertsii ARSEF 23]
MEEDWHELARMLPDRPLEEEDIDILGRRDIDVDYDWTPHVGRYTDDGILNGDYWKQRKARNRLDLDVDHQPLEARDSLNRDQRLVYDTVMDHFLNQEPSQLLLHVDGGGGTGKSYLINLLSAHPQAAAARRGTPAKLDDEEVARFANALRVYATKDRVNEYNHYHLDRLGRPVIQVKAKNVGPSAAAAPDDKARNLAKQIPICIGACLMLTSNLWQPVGLCNGARGTVYDIGWAPGANPVQEPCVIMTEFDKYSGPVFLTTADDRQTVPIRDFLIGATHCTRTQFPLIVCYAITVHKSQSITENVIVTTSPVGTFRLVSAT